MKGLKFTGNRVEDAANAFVDVLKYSDQSIDYPEFEYTEPWPEDIIELFHQALQNESYSEQTSILMYTKQASDFDSISELMLGIGLVEMRHYDKLNDFLSKADPDHHNTMKVNISIPIGDKDKEALDIALKAEMDTIAHYKKIQYEIKPYIDRVDYEEADQLLTKLIKDEEHHVKLLKEAIGSPSITIVLK